MLGLWLPLSVALLYYSNLWSLVFMQQCMFLHSHAWFIILFD
jgi:hypothetical protein